MHDSVTISETQPCLSIQYMVQKFFLQTSDSLLHLAVTNCPAKLCHY